MHATFTLGDGPKLALINRCNGFFALKKKNSNNLDDFIIIPIVVFNAFEPWNYTSIKSITKGSEILTHIASHRIPDQMQDDLL